MENDERFVPGMRCEPGWRHHQLIAGGRLGARGKEKCGGSEQKRLFHQLLPEARVTVSQ
jgi:hypothetical protein